ncbi:hypothetical protein CkaCkLH20_06674 [Colletotrichum karsti]|uniref:Uncharacterized protein n=1 Tax=Colletotrichum karsti TaxID=1095194 RepID=A0A9P6I2G3_9PEZI|nr:uncharacterized protein CkaCkLH20_06674 [Colletotrichum karsti]KAF9875742.1 hypothetical protein CkaCkLH20_06674 [Colletotrichum karsti]
MTSTAAQRNPGKPRRDRSDSLQKMLELEHLQKLERLQGHQHQHQHQSLPTPAHQSQMAFQQVLSHQLNQGRPSHSPPRLSPFPTLHPPPQVKPLVPIQSRRRDTLPPQEPEPLPSAMKAARRTIAVPSLSISVPPPANTHTEIDRALVPRESADHKHKTVTFLGVDTQDEPKEDDESSICHSPSWEAFGGKKKKEKKNEDKMRRKEKEQAEKLAEKEAKSVKKRLTAKLHKTPPVARPPNSSRSMSSPIMLADERLRPASTQAYYEAPPPIRPQHARQRSDSVAMQLKAAITGQKMHYPGNDEPSFIGGLKLDQERQTASGVPLRKPLPPVSLANQRAQSFGPDVRVAVSGAFNPPTLPHSASDGPMAPGMERQQDRPLRPKSQHISMKVPSWNQQWNSPAVPPVPDVSKLQQWKDRPTRYPVPVPTDTEEIELTLVEPNVDFEQDRGRRRESYVHNHRQQSKERSINGFNDEVRVSSAKSHYPPQANQKYQPHSYSSSSETSPMANNFPPRNGSLTNLNSSKDHPSPGDDFVISFRLPYTPPANDSPRHGSFDRSLSEQPPISRERILSKEFPLPPDRSESRERLPPTPGAAIRSFKDAAKAAFNRVSPSASKPPVSNYFTRAARDTTLTPDSTSSSRYSSLDHLPLSAPPVRPPFAESAEPSMPSRDSSARPTDRSSMSSFEEPMSSPSPATTPDSSRPQSEKGVHSVDEEVRRVDNEPLVVDNDERSYRHSHKAAMQMSSPVASNPRISLPPQIPVQNHEAHLSELEALVSEKFGKKASVADCESDSEACLTPAYTDTSKNGSALASPATSVSMGSSQEFERKQPHKETEDVSRMVEEELQNFIQRRPSLSKSRSSPDLALDTSFLPKLKHQPLVPRPLVPPPPPRSAKRTSSPTNKSPAPSPLSSDARKSIVSLKASSNPSNYLEQARKSMPVPPRSSRASRASIVPPDGAPEPVAKMLVECCSCKFLHDMPSKVYECMAQPDGMVEDHKLGVSGVISTTVKCPWCSHGMTTKCCAGYAAVIYLKEKLH